MKEIKFELTPSFTSNSFIPFDGAATTRPFIHWFNKTESVSVGITLISLKYMYNVLFSVFFSLKLLSMYQYIIFHVRGPVKAM